MSLYLKNIDTVDKERVLDYISELVLYGSERDGLWYEDSPSYEDMLANLKRHEKIRFIKYEQDEVPNFQYLLIRSEDDKMVGAVSVRPYLTKSLDESFGGNIGYSIRPTERRKGYAKVALKLGIEKCREKNPGLDIIVCCYKDNIGSKKTIIDNGGVLIEERQGTITYQKYKINV